MMSRLLTRREQVVLGSLAAALLTGSITVFWLRTASPESPEIVVQPADSPAPSMPLQSSPADVPTIPRPVELIVSVQGAVVKPGVYRADDGSRVNDLIAMAGGLMPSADTSTINLAARAVDGTTLTVPTRGSPTDLEATIAPPSNPDVYALSATASTNSALGFVSSGSRLVDLNSATQQELETLPGIGPKLAQRIIQYRSAQPFRDVTDLLNVSGIGEAKLAAVQELVTVN